MTIHTNSVISKKKLKVGGRHNRILQIFHIYDRPMTDREIKEIGKFDDMNDVRPRITELLETDPPRLKECGNVIDVKTQRPVRTTRLLRPEEIKQGELF